MLMYIKEEGAWEGAYNVFQSYSTQNTFFFFWLLPASCRISVPQLGTEAGATTVKAPSPKHGPTRELSQNTLLYRTSLTLHGPRELQFSKCCSRALFTSRSGVLR